jgi:hypothetical protein
MTIIAHLLQCLIELLLEFFEIDTQRFAQLLGSRRVVGEEVATPAVSMDDVSVIVAYGTAKWTGIAFHAILQVIRGVNAHHATPGRRLSMLIGDFFYDIMTMAWGYMPVSATGGRQAVPP